jgi:photosystem II stability/assembly factor-like uncharacterized protein
LNSGGKTLLSKTLRMATLEGGNMEVHKITNQGLWGIATTLMLVWSAGFSLPVTVLMMQNSGISPLQASTTWEILSHSFIQKESTLRDVAFLNATHGWVVGQKEVGLGGGIILYTNDSGDSWQLQFHNYSQHFDAIHIIDHQTLWVTCRGGFVYSVDGGQSWSSISIIDGMASLGFVKFINATHGWTSTMRDVYRTEDGGLTWHNVTSWQFYDVLWGMHFISPTRIWAIGGLGVYYTDDGGEIWEAKYPRGGRTISFVSDTEGWAVGSDILLHMTDGETWVEQAKPRKTLGPLYEIPQYTDVLFLDSNHGWIAGGEIPVAFTPTGGASWYGQQVQNELDILVMALDFTNLTHGWAVGTGGYILRTVSGDDMGDILLLDGSPFSLLNNYWLLWIIMVVGICIAFSYDTRKRRTDSIESRNVEDLVMN